MRQSVLLFFAILISCTGLYGQKTSNKKASYSILFVGNSLTYTNDLPLLLKKYAKQKGVVVSTKMIAYPNYAIEDHWNDGKVQKLIESKKYDFVIIQQGPSSQPDGRKMLIDYGKKYNKLCMSSNAKLCYFMVWPSLRYYHTFENVIKNHKDAAAANSSILLPVGKVWKEYIKTTKDYGYYSADRFHPSLKGSQVAAKVIFETLFVSSSDKTNS